MKHMNKKWYRVLDIIQNTSAVCCLLAATHPASGSIIGSDVINADGTVTYTYVVNNSTGASGIAAWSLEFGFPIPDWNPLDTFSGGQVTVPNGDWVAGTGIPVNGQSAQDFISFNLAADVAAGQSLSGFSFTSKFLPGQVEYNEFFEDGHSNSGTTIGPIRTANNVPEGRGPIEALGAIALAVFAVGMRGNDRRHLTSFAA